MKKRSISIVLTLAMIIGMIPFGAMPVFAQDTNYKETLVIKDNTTISNMTFSGNYEGSAIVITDNARYVEFENVTFENITSNGNGACIYIDSKEGRQTSLNFTNCRFSNCSSKENGGAIYIDGDNVNIGFENTVASNCSSNMGGFMHIDGLGAFIDGNDSTVIQDCSAEYGGAICVKGKNVKSNVLIENLSFVSNKSKRNGGAVCVFAHAKEVEIKFCNFYGNGAGYSGGAAFADFYASMKVFACVFYDNFADICGDETSNIETSIPTFICDKEECTEENHIKFGTIKVYGHKPTADYTLKKSNDGKYHIGCNEDWFSFYQDVTVKGKDFAGETVVLETDIAAYKPIGNFKDNKKFKGTFDGGNHTVNVSNIDAATSDKGVFAATDGAKIRNLTANGVLKGQYSLGGIVGNAVATSFRNCKSYMSIDGTESYGGGIVGCSSYDSTYFYCANFGNIKMKEKTGGIVGRARPNTVILNCLNFGDVSGEKYISGLIGYEDGEGNKDYAGKAVTVGNAHVLGNVTASVSDANAVTGRSIPDSVYELCLYNEDGCPADSNGIGVSKDSLYGKTTDTVGGKEFKMPDYVNDYITQNSKNTQRWLYMDNGEDGTPFFVSHNDYDYTVTFSVPKDVAAISDKKVIDGEAVTLPTAVDIENFTFYGWTTEKIDSESTQKPAVLSGEYTPFGSITLYAVYTCTKSDNITYYTTAPIPCQHENTKTVGAKDATCTEKGYTGDTVCADCGKVLAKGEDVKELGHAYCEEITKPATCVNNGEITYYCPRCKVIYTDIIPKTGIHSWVPLDAETHKCENCPAVATHIYLNGECACGRKEPGPNINYFYIRNTGSDAVTVSWKNAINDIAANLAYSINNKTSFAKFGGSVELNAGDICYFRGLNESLSDVRVVCNTPNATLAAGGDIGTLLNELGNVATYPSYAFCNIFFNLGALTDISNLTLCKEDTVLGIRCFAGMFVGCKGLTEIPDNFLPATALAEGCYKNMFDSCSSLESIPENLLPAIDLEDSCYLGMFKSCTTLTTIPEKLLPALNLAEHCYESMFSQCDNLTKAPDLPAKQLCNCCYMDMFFDCKNLTRIKVSFMVWGNDKDNATYFFLSSGINNTLTIYCPFILDTESRGVYCIPEHTSVNIIYFSEVLLAAAGGTGGTASVTALPGRALPDITVPVREGYVFEGYFDLEGIKYYNADGAGIKNWNKKDATAFLVAIWTTVPTHEHTFSEDWNYNETHHWHESTCEHKGFVSDFSEHTFDEGKKNGNITVYTCTACGYNYTVDKTGDGDGNGKIDSNDLIILRKALLLGGEYNEVLDTNGDGNVNLLDLIRLKKHIADETVPLGKQGSEQQTEEPINEIANLPDNKQII